MSASSPQTAPPAGASDAAGGRAKTRRRRVGVWLSVMTILMGVGSLMLALLPPIIYNEPFRWPWDKDEKKPPAQIQGKVILETKRFYFTFGNKNKPSTQPAVVEEPVSPIKPYRLAMIVVCCVGLGLAPAAWIRERHRPLAGTGAALCCAALFWQFLLIGIVVGVAIGVLFIFFSHL